MNNWYEKPFEQILERLTAIEQNQEKILKLIATQEKLFQMLSKPPENARVTLSDFCREYRVSKVTAYKWGLKQLIKIEKIGRICYVPLASITVPRKHVE
jgi:hypothetical protein